MPTSVIAVKLGLSVLALYRVIKAPPKLKLSTITDPYKGEIPCSSLQQEIACILDKRFGFARGKFVFGFTWRYSQSVGPNKRSAVWSAPWDAFAFFREPKVMMAFAVLAPWWITLYIIFLGLIVGCTPAAMRKSMSSKPPVLGRLSEKEEAAGKVRVFAITDW